MIEPGTKLPWSRDRSELLGADDTLIALFLSSAQSFQTWHIDPAKSRLAHTPEAERALDYAIHAANNHAPLVEALADFLENPLFQVTVGGNPNAVEAMLANARQVLAAARGEG